MLTWDDMSWTYETTAPEPEPWPDDARELVAVCGADASDVTTWVDDADREHYLKFADALLDELAARYPGVRAAITGGEQA